MPYAVSLSQTATSLGIVLAVATLVGLWLTHYKVVRPWWRKLKRDVVGGRDVLVGRPAIIDPVTKKEIAPALASLGERLDSNQTEINGTLRDIVSLLESQRQQQRWNEAMETRVTLLESGAVERIVTKAESASAWRAVEAVANGHTEPADDDPELG
jgi:hypothetical protein